MPFPGILAVSRAKGVLWILHEFSSSLRRIYDLHCLRYNLDLVALHALRWCGGFEVLGHLPRYVRLFLPRCQYVVLLCPAYLQTVQGSL